MIWVWTACDFKVNSTFYSSGVLGISHQSVPLLAKAVDQLTRPGHGALTVPKIVTVDNHWLFLDGSGVYWELRESRWSIGYN